MSKAQEFYDKEIKNDHFIEGYKDNVADGYEYEYDKLLRRLSRIFKAEIGRRISATKKREMLREIESEINDFIERIKDISSVELAQFMETYHESLAKITRELDLTAPDYTPIRGYMNKQKPLTDGDVISVNSMITVAGAALYTSLSHIVARMQLIEEDETVLLGNFYESVTKRGRNNLRTTAVTAVALISGFTRDSFFRKSSDIIGHQHISVLDEKTTDTCQFRHSKVWYYLDSMSDLSTLPDSLTPPLHRNCRSEDIPIFRGEEPIAEENYQEWFERQDEDTKREVLGKERYDVYTKSGATIGQFSDVRGNRYTLDELRQMIN